MLLVLFFFFKQRTAYEMRISDWSSDVCSSDLDDPELYRKINALIPNLVIQAEEDGPGDFSVDEKAKQVHLTEDGHEKVENLMRVSQLLGEEDSLYDADRKSVVEGKSVAIRVDLGGRRSIKKKQQEPKERQANNKNT